MGQKQALLEELDTLPSDPYKGTWDFSTSGRQLESIEQLNRTGTPQEVDISVWRLEIKGTGVPRPLLLSYEELSRMPRIKAAPLLICPGVFEDLAEWEGIALKALLERAGASASWTELVVTSIDRYPAVFSREEIDGHLMLIALMVNGQILPQEHGFPARLVAERILGGRWVKWIASIELR